MPKNYHCFASVLPDLVVIKTAWKYTYFSDVQSQHSLQVILLLQSNNKLLVLLAALITSHL